MAGYIMDVSRISLSTFNYKQLAVIGDSPPACSAHTAVVYKKYIYLFGGWDGNETTDNFYKLNLKKKKWSVAKSKSAKPSPRRSHISFVKDDCIYIWGGFDGTANCSTELHQYHVPTKKWSIIETKGTPPAARSRSQAVVFHGRVAIFGGWDRKDHFEDWHEFDFGTKTWTSYPTKFPTKAIGQHTAQCYRNCVYVFGGYNSDNTASCNLFWGHSLGHLGLQDAS
eukprot:TRINITY_DN659_c0_g2_i1.p1 TRINITY_DN659_c0_g2~~TRINITY_DN659_c0_g2_i1.p1  ORF type:complete len:225 (+),score=45.53 TRINITY_DN659_c0_g2_i1:742-1416(+)